MENQIDPEWVMIGGMLCVLLGVVTGYICRMLSHPEGKRTKTRWLF